MRRGTTAERGASVVGLPLVNREGGAHDNMCKFAGHKTDTRQAYKFTAVHKIIHRLKTYFYVIAMLASFLVLVWTWYVSICGLYGASGTKSAYGLRAVDQYQQADVRDQTVTRVVTADCHRATSRLAWSAPRFFKAVLRNGDPAITCGLM